MARLVSARDAKRICKAHRDKLEGLLEIINLEESLKMGIMSACNDVVNREILNLLRAVPVEEINRNKAGIRVKTLHDAGIHTMADVANTTRAALQAINGISEDASITIKKVCDTYTARLAGEVKIRLSADNKDAMSTAIVKAVCKYHKYKKLAVRAKSLYEAYHDRIEDRIQFTEPACHTIKWLMTSQSIKTLAEDAYKELALLWYGEYGSEAGAISDELQALYNLSDRQAWDDFSVNSIQYFTTLEKLCPGLVGSNDSLYGLPEELAGEIQKENVSSAGLKCSLRNYQEWGVKYILHQGNVLLGDEMGLGKTVQAIAAMVSLAGDGATHFMVVCPASVITNWCREIVKHSNLAVYKIHGAERHAMLMAWEKAGGVAVTTYETTGMFDLLPEFKYEMLVVDEAHYIKNPEAKRTINVAKLAESANRLLFMTGTALENKVDEMINLVRLLNPEVANQISGYAFMATAPQFREKIAPVYYRRKREDVLMELPDLIESREWCTLNAGEIALYEASVLAKDYTNIRRVSWNMDDLSKSSKAQRLTEIIAEAETEGRKVLVFSFYLDTIRSLYDYLGNKCLNPINGSVSPARRQEIIDEFDRAPAGTVLLAQIQSGGTGLNIQAASVVVICEPQFKPSIENQAIARAYRMGQARNVLVYRLLADETVDERVMELLEDKQAVFDAFADRSVAADNTSDEEIDDNTFAKIVEEEIKRIQDNKKDRE